jgi:hypothetical protein
MVIPELLDLLATWISDNKAIGVSSITLQLRGSISDNSIPIKVSRSAFSALYTKQV